MALVDPCMIITSYDNWKNPNKIDYSQIMEKEYQGYLHILTGLQETALERLSKIHFINEPYDAVFLDLDFWSSFSASDATKLNDVLSPKCAIVVKGDMAKWSEMDNLEKNFEEYNFKIVARLYDVCIFARQ